MNYGAIAMCAIDFVRALRERWIARMLFRFVVGKYAYSEFMLLIESLNKAGLEPFPGFGYGLEDMNYHKDKYTNEWWKENT
jgi:hypothetical protein